MKHLPGHTNEPEAFAIEFVRVGCLTFRLNTSQLLHVPKEKAFSFFQDPANLFAITPDWLDFRRVVVGREAEVTEGAEYDYTIQWLGIRLPWRSRIKDYMPPDRFTDIQVRGPYRYWKHEHRFEDVPEGTRVKDEVTYRLPVPGLGQFVHRFLVQKQLEEIFRYRARKIAEWVRLESKPV
jgi:ligand-binding SRPBCC domain-containing protein